MRGGNGDPRVRPLLRDERGGNRGDRGEILARRITRRRLAASRGWSRGTDARQEAVRPALPRAGLGGPARHGHRSPPRGSLPRDRSRPRSPDAAAGAAGRRPDRGRARPRDGRAPCPKAAGERHARPGGRPRRRPRLARSSAPFRVAGNLPYNVSSPILFALIAAQPRARRHCRRDADAAARGGRRGCTPCRAPATTACCRFWSSSTPTSRRCCRCRPGAFRPAPKVHSSGRPAALQAARSDGPGRGRFRGDGPDRCSCSGARRCCNALQALCGVGRARRRPGAGGRRHRPGAASGDAATYRAGAACGDIRFGLSDKLCYSLRDFAQSLDGAVPAAPGGHMTRLPAVRTRRSARQGGSPIVPCPSTVGTACFDF